MNNNFDLSVNNEEMTVAMVDDNNKMIADLTTRTMSYCSIVAETFEDKKILFNSMNNPEKRTGDCINEVINLRNVYVESVNCVNQDTGEVTVCPRVVLIDDNNVGYQSVSLGIFSALKKLFSTFGEPNTWGEAIPIKIKQLTKGERKILTFEIA